MSSIKKLAGQTLWYGVSSIAARFINYLLTPYLTYNALIKPSDYGKMSAVYAAIPLFNIIFTYGMETAYFRFIQQKEKQEAVNNTATISLFVTSILFSIMLWLNQDFLAGVASLKDLPSLIQLSIIIIGLDALSTIPFARLRNEGRPRLFALIKIAGIVINVLATVFFLSWCPKAAEANPNSWIILIYDKNINPINYVLWANVFQSAFTLLLLGKWVMPAKWKFDFNVWKEMMLYALPMLIAGMGGMVNETFDRLMLGWWLPGNDEYVDAQRGIYGACYKLSILITLFIQAFRMGAEPFFFKQAQGQNPQRTYARVTKFFVITVSVMFLVVMLYLPGIKCFIDKKYWDGLAVVPILLMENICLGIYYNLSVWYKITASTMAGAWITLIGTTITFIINYAFIPTHSYMASAWATFLCYCTMMVVSFMWGQKKYYVPYAWKKLLAYLVIALLLWLLHKVIAGLWDNIYFSLTLGTLLIGAYTAFIIKIEKKEFQQMPVIGRWIK